MSTLVGATGFSSITGLALQARPSDSDFYAVTLTAAQSLEVETSTPADSTGEFVNQLDPMIRLYDSTGHLVATDDNSAPDHRNALLKFNNGLVKPNVLKGMSGTYFIEVTASNATATPTGGEYILAIKGATGALPPFQVTKSSPPDAARLRGPVTQMTVKFNDNVLLTSLQASDLTVDGIPSTGLTLLDGETALFTLPPGLSEGIHRVAIAAGALRDVQGTPVAAFASQFYNDITPPRVVGISLQENGVAPVGDLTYTVQFSEPMNTANPPMLATSLHGVFRDTFFSPIIASYNADGTVLTLEYTSLPEDRYTLTLSSGDGRFEDLVGLDLDGEPVAFPIPPNQSGNGIEGGDFSVDFALDLGATTAFPTPLTPVAPLGSLIYDGSFTGVIGTSGDTDSFTLALDAGQTISVVVDPSATLQPTVNLVGPSGGAPLGSALAGAVGQGAVVQTIMVTTAGTYRINVGGAAGTVGLYTVQVVLNAAVENESHDGSVNNTLLTAQNIDPSFTPLVKGATRGAVLGRTEPGGNYVASAVPFSFEDISATGTPTLQSTIDSFDFLGPAVLDGFKFNFYGTTYDSLFISTDGLITFGFAAPPVTPINTDLTSSPPTATIAPFWNQLGTFAPGAAVFHEVRGTGDNQRLIIQWNHVQFAGSVGGTITFQAVLSEADGSIQFNYLTLSAGDASRDEGRSATVGIKDVGFQGPNRLLVSYFSGPNAFVGTGQSTRLVLLPPPLDLYAFTLNAGQSASVVAKALSRGNTHLELLDPGGNVVAHDLSAASLSNGSFETGDFTGWTVATTGAPFVPWTVSPAGAGSGFFPPTSPQDGTFDAWNGFDGAGPMEYTMFQDVAIPAGSPLAQLSWQDRVQWNFALTGSATQPRLYDVEVLNPDTSAALATLFSFSTGTALVVGDTGWQTHTADLSAFAGSTVRLLFREVIPESFTGPGQIEFDAIRLDVGGPQNVDNLINGFVAPATGTYYIRITGQPNTDYSVVITRDAVFDVENNDTQTRAQPLGALHVALGHVGAPGDATDDYSFTAAAGQSFHLFTATPADGPGEFGNSLNPHLILRAPDGTSILGALLSDGRNEEIVYTATVAGTYIIEVSAEGGTSGEYILDPSPLEAIGGLPVAGSAATGPSLTGIGSAGSATATLAPSSTGALIVVPSSGFATTTMVTPSGSFIGALLPGAVPSSAGIVPASLPVGVTTMFPASSSGSRRVARNDARVSATPRIVFRVARRVPQLSGSAAVDDTEVVIPQRASHEEQRADPDAVPAILIEPGLEAMGADAATFLQALDACLADEERVGELTDQGRSRLLDVVLSSAAALAAFNIVLNAYRDRQATPLELRPRRLVSL